MKRLIEAVALLREDMKVADLHLPGKMPPLVTIQFQEIRDEARYHEYLRRSASNEHALTYLDRSRMTIFRPDCFACIAGIDVRISSSDRVDEAVRRLFK